MIKWYYHTFANGRQYANNGKLKIYANSCTSRNKLIRKYGHCKGVVSQRSDGSVKEMLFEEESSLIKYNIVGISVDHVDISTLLERDYVIAETEFDVLKWNTSPSIKYFEKSEVTIPLSSLPEELQMQYRQFESDLIEYIKSQIGKEGTG